MFGSRCIAWGSLVFLQRVEREPYSLFWPKVLLGVHSGVEVLLCLFLVSVNTYYYLSPTPHCIQGRSLFSLFHYCFLCIVALEQVVEFLRWPRFQVDRARHPAENLACFYVYHRTWCTRFQSRRYWVVWLVYASSCGPSLFFLVNWHSHLRHCMEHHQIATLFVVSTVHVLWILLPLSFSFPLVDSVQNRQTYKHFGMCARTLLTN